MAEQDETMTRITDVIALLHTGERERARDAFTAIWQELGPDGDPLCRCTLAHFMADAQEKPEDELLWDLRALEAGESMTAERVAAHHASMTLESFFPSLHLNLAADYQKLGDAAAARAHLAKARARVDALPDTELGNLTRGAIDRLANQLV